VIRDVRKARINIETIVLILAERCLVLTVALKYNSESIVHQVSDVGLTVDDELELDRDFVWYFISAINRT
jgi:hypothetical protein